jgi:Cu-Zn family superoxide dismutase
MRFVRHALPLALLLVAGSLAACAGAKAGPATLPDIVVGLRAADGREVGTAALHEQADGVRIDFRLSGLTPGAHGAHIHAVGRCDPPAFASAGPHLNPGGKKHGHQSPDGWHLGDVGNVTAAADGRAELSIVVRGATLTAGPQSLLGPEGVTALVIHEKADDEMTDPAGAAGPRIACGVIRRQ